MEHNELAKGAAFLEEMKKYFTDPALWGHILFVIVKIALICIAGRIVIKIMNTALQHMMQEREKNLLKINQRRTKTIGRLLGNVVKYAVYFIVFLLALNQVGVNLAPLIAGAGVVGLAIGFGAQSLVKDVITGFFIIFEDQFAVGDVVQIGKYQGTVEEIGLRITRLKSWTGEVHIIPNGSITDVTNYSINNSIAVVDVPVSNEIGIEQALQTLKEVALKVHETTDETVKEPQILGVQSLGNSDTVIRLIAECRPNTSGIVVRKFNQEIKAAFDRMKLAPPSPHTVT